MSGNVAVLIDYENTGIEPIRDLIKKLANEGRISICRAYGDWTGQIKNKNSLLEIGIEPVHHFKPIKGKRNSSDIALAVDGVEIAYRLPVETFVIASADSDFIPLVQRLRAMGKSVIGAGRRSAATDGLKNVYDRFIDLEPVDKARPTVRSKRVVENTSGTPSDWDREIDRMWSARNSTAFSGPQAASDAVKVLGVPNLKSSEYSSLQRLIDGSQFLKKRWRRDGNVIHRIG